MRRIALKHRVPHAEVQSVWKSQFKFAKEVLESYSKEFLATASKEELEEIVINFIYLGKIYTAESLQKFGNKKNNIKGENKDGCTESLESGEEQSEEKNKEDGSSKGSSDD